MENVVITDTSRITVWLASHIRVTLKVLGMLLLKVKCSYFCICFMFVQIILQGPLGWQSFSGLPTGQTLWERDVYFLMNDEHSEISPISWEATVQKHIEDELYDSSLKVCPALDELYDAKRKGVLLKETWIIPYESVSLSPLAIG